MVTAGVLAVCGASAGNNAGGSNEVDPNGHLRIAYPVARLWIRTSVLSPDS